MTPLGWRSWGPRVRTFRAGRVGVVSVRVLGRQVQASVSPSSVWVTWGLRVVDAGRWPG